MAILIKDCLPHSLLPPINTAIEQVSVKLWNGVVVAGCYAPPNLTITDNHLTNIFRQGNKVLALGDFNSRHTSWKNATNNPDAIKVYDYASDNDIQILGTPTPTHYGRQGTNPSYIDIGLNKNITNIQELQVHSELSSDHNPTYLS